MGVHYKVESTSYIQEKINGTMNGSTCLCQRLMVLYCSISDVLEGNINCRGENGGWGKLKELQGFSFLLNGGMRFYDLITYSCVFLYIVRNRSTDSIFDITNTSSAVTCYCLNDCMGNISDWASTGHYGIHWQPHAGNLMYCADRVLSQYSLNR